MAHQKPVLHKGRHFLPSFLVVLAAGIFSLAGNSCAKDELLWFQEGRSAVVAFQAVELLQRAEGEGLDPADYNGAGFSHALNQFVAGKLHAEGAVVELDRSLTATMLRYLSDLHGGRVQPGQVSADYPLEKTLDFSSLLSRAIAARNLDELNRLAMPANPLYPGLRQALQQYLKLAEHPAWREKLPLLPKRKLEVGQDYAGLPLLAQRLQVQGDLPVSTPVSFRYEPALAEGIKLFQFRHGLEPDGIIGARTFEQLQITPAQRARQIALNLERLRWTPLNHERMVVVNIPEFALYAYKTEKETWRQVLTTPIIVGRALKTPTPVFSKNMRFIEFSPYWNVPRSIARNETIPKLRRDPAYFRQEEFEFVARNGQVQGNLSSANLNAVLRGELRIRQRPGPENALGTIKFVFPNDENIYLHDTAAKKLFEQKRRDFSHGCIRVADPLGLAKFVLEGDPAWDEEKIVTAMNARKSRTIRLREPLPVVVAYLTAGVGHDGRLYFFPDIYGYDQVLDDALRRVSRF